MVGIPGSIARHGAWLARCRRLLLVGRQPSPPRTRLTAELGAEFLVDIPEALSGDVVVSATSTGNCIDPVLLLPGSVVIDIGVPTDVISPKTSARRCAAALRWAGACRTRCRDSMFLGTGRPVLPGRDDGARPGRARPECFSLGRDLSLERIEEIGVLARKHGFDFSQLFSFGQKLESSALARFRKAMARRGPENRRPAARNGVHPKGAHPNGTSHPKAPLSPPAESTVAQLAARAAQLHERYINPILVGIGQKTGFIKTFVRVHEVMNCGTPTVRCTSA